MKGAVETVTNSSLPAASEGPLTIDNVTCRNKNASMPGLFKGSLCFPVFIAISKSSEWAKQHICVPPVYNSK